MTYEQYSRLAHQAADCEDLESACRLIQDALGQTDGGVAAVVFSDIEREDWVELPIQEKRRRMEEYAVAEFYYSPITCNQFKAILAHGVEE